MANGAAQCVFGGWAHTDRRPYLKGSHELGRSMGAKLVLSSARQNNVREGSDFWLLLSPSAQLHQARVWWGQLDCGKLQMF